MNHIQINGFNCRYKHIKHDTANETIVFLNGIANPLESWNDFHLAFKTQYNILGYDLRGQWFSEVTAPPYTFQQASEDLKALLDYLNITDAHFVGTSFGGEVGLHFAIHHQNYCKSLTVIASVSEIEPLLYYQAHRWQQAAQSAKKIFNTPVLDEPTRLEVLGYLHDIFLPDSYSNDFFKHNKEIITGKRIGMQKKAPISFPEGFDYLCEMFYRLADEENLTPLLKNITCPSLIISGEYDIVKPPFYSKIIADNIPNSKYLELPAGHAVTVERAPELTEIISQFLHNSL